MIPRRRQVSRSYGVFFLIRYSAGVILTATFPC